MFSIVIPVYNEELVIVESLTKLTTYLKSLEQKYEIIVVSNGSTDQTVALVEEFDQGVGIVRAITLPERSVGEAFVRGVTAARYEQVITLDADLSSDLHFVEYALHLLKFGDMVVGSKTLGAQRRSLLRVIASQSYILCAQLIFNLTISDYSMGCKAFKRSAILPLLPHLSRWTGYIFECALFLSRKGFRIIQVGVDCNDTRKSRFNLFHEGVYRYYHLYQCYRSLKNQKSFWNTL